MCSECHCNPCVSGCPNAPDPTPVLRCSKCKEGIFTDEEYAVINGNVYCEYCLDEMPHCVLIPLCGGEWLKAGEVEE